MLTEKNCLMWSKFAYFHDCMRGGQICFNPLYACLIIVLRFELSYNGSTVEVIHYMSSPYIFVLLCVNDAAAQQ